MDALNEALTAAREKTGLAAITATGRFPVKLVTDTLGVARSNLVEQTKSTGWQVLHNTASEQLRPQSKPTISSFGKQ